MCMIYFAVFRDHEYCCHAYIWIIILFPAKDLLLFMINSISHPATRRRDDVVTASLCTSQQRLRYASNETPNDVSVERRQDVSVVRLHDVLLVCHDDVSRERNDNVPSVCLHDVSNKSQTKHPKTSQWYVFTTSH